ncbi:MAG: hypothetical protein Q9227_003605 [Pyrenula ochraceoflavens]
MTQAAVVEKAKSATKFAHQAEKLSLTSQNNEDGQEDGSTAVQAKFITPIDNVIETADGQRLPGVPPMEALKFNELKDQVVEQVESSESSSGNRSADQYREHQHDIEERAAGDENGLTEHSSRSKKGKLDTTVPPSRTHPLFPPLPLYGPPSVLRNWQCTAFRISSFFLSLAFLMVIVLGSAFTYIPIFARNLFKRLTFRDPGASRPFFKEEKKRSEARRQAEKLWKRQKKRRKSNSESAIGGEERRGGSNEDYTPTEGGPDPVICDVSYYARRVGLDVETYRVQTEDGFIITLWHLYNPLEYTPASPSAREPATPELFTPEQLSNSKTNGCCAQQFKDGQRRYPVLLIHGLLQSAGAYCTNDDSSLAFYLHKSGYDVWLGNNRCGFTPEHAVLSYSDPRMWAWNIRAFGVLDLPALVSRVLAETGFEKLGLVCHSQGTTETFVALAKDQRPDLGKRISVFCALAPAAYAGPLIGKMYFKFMRIISPGMFRIFFGIHAFIPFMMSMHRLLPGKIYGMLGYRVFSFLFNWTDTRWERDLRDRMFQFAPVYVSAESMRWWLGRECFAKQKCILATREEGRKEEDEDANDNEDPEEESEETEQARKAMKSDDLLNQTNNKAYAKGNTAWYDERAPKMAFWVCGSDDLVDGKRLLARFRRGREPHVEVVHAKVIEEYEHLDVLWAIDAIEQVGCEVREVLWRTAEEDARKVCRVPRGCEGVWTEG